MKRFAWYICLILVFSLIIAVPAYAVESRSMDASYYYSYTNAYLSKISDTTFQVTYQANGTGVMDEIGVSYMEIQRSSDNSDWETVATYSNLIGYNTGSHQSSVIINFCVKHKPHLINLLTAYAVAERQLDR